MNNPEYESESIKAIGTSVIKVIMILCTTFFMCYWIESCSLSPEAVQECKSVCDTDGSQMSSVTTRECRCTKSVEMVLPRR